ncbi:MAG: cyclase family protein, partial [Chloroflexi bacterium]|nr:cyclase family protein [Chloroflexota bacterium]
MKMISLTMPFYEGMGYGNAYPQEQPFQVEWIYTWEVHGHQRGVHTFSSEPGTRMILPSICIEQKNSPKLDEIDLTKFVLKDTVILDVPKKANEEVTAKDIDQALAKVTLRTGDAIMVRTGWGTEERLLKLGDDFEMTSPYYSDDSMVRIIEVMKRNKSDLFCYDVANCGDYKEMKATWCAQKPRPKSWISPEAKAYVAKQSQQSPHTGIFERRGIMRLFVNGIACIGGVVNANRITKPRFKLIALPFRVKGWGVAGCYAM